MAAQALPGVYLADAHCAPPLVMIGQLPPATMGLPCPARPVHSERGRRPRACVGLWSSPPPCQME